MGYKLRCGQRFPWVVTIKFWTDRWCGEPSLRVRFPNLYQIASFKDASVKDLLSYHNTTLHWDVCFIREAQDWEKDTVTEFMELLYSVKISRDKDDVLCWNPSSRDIFDLKSFYNVLHTGAAQHFPWKSVWKSKTPSKVSFFLWTAVLGKVLTTDNLCKRRLIVLDWCCMCKRDGETIATCFFIVQWPENYGI